MAGNNLPCKAMTPDKRIKSGARTWRLMRASGVEKQINIWFTGNLGDAMLAGVSLDHIKAVSLPEYENAGYSKELAVFIRNESAKEQGAEGLNNNSTVPLSWASIHTMEKPACE